MRYSESKEQSSEYLRLALPLMVRQAAAHHPVSYTLWYEHVGGMNPPLSEVLTARLESGPALTDDEVYRLHARYISARDIEILERLQQQLRTLLEEAAHAAAAAGEESGQYARNLEESHTRIGEATSLESVHQIIAQLLNETRAMQISTRALSQQLEQRAHEVAALTEQLEHVQSEALLDPLCGLKNRRGLERSAQSIFDGGLSGTALLIADVDRFKNVNDTHGHLLGDKVLRAIAATLRANIKGRDIAARIGGDEFAALLPQTSLQGALALAEHIRAAVADGRIHRGDGKDFVGSVTLSIGIAIRNPGEPLESLMERADAALYDAKRAGRNCIRTAAAS